MSEFLSRISRSSGEVFDLVMVMENNLKAWRESRGLSQQQVADIFRQKYGKSSVRKQTISRWERGRRDGKLSLPDLENAFILAKIYNCKVDDLFCLED